MVGAQYVEAMRGAIKNTVANRVVSEARVAERSVAPAPSLPRIGAGRGNVQSASLQRVAGFR